MPRVSKKALSEAGRLLVQGAINIGAAGGKARALALSPEERTRIAKMGAAARLRNLKQKKAKAKKRAA